MKGCSSPGLLGGVGWVETFRKRRGVVLRVTTTIDRKFAQTDDDKIQEEFFLHRIFEAVSVNQPHPYYIMSMDKTSVRLQNTYKMMLSPKGAKEVQVVQPLGNPECLTKCFTVFTDGTKFPASIVFKGDKETGKSPRILNKLMMPENVRIFSTHSGAVEFGF
ncbi:hypothetical protein RvY_03127 [Ramazzottius varieornatus]|uniref:HTH CENPB-type domain-containing protein n=1 Tax=Ramazzottius varieornatus TaxID=947166 RepID=A0A1D1UWH6_RAMVA|nr:hypothetical protein RvY_03127 [Ramazzottius varieornatus]